MGLFDMFKNNKSESIFELVNDPRNSYYGAFFSLNELYCAFEQLNLPNNDILTFVLDYEARDVPKEYGGEAGVFWEFEDVDVYTPTIHINTLGSYVLTYGEFLDAIRWKAEEKGWGFPYTASFDYKPNTRFVSSNFMGNVVPYHPSISLVSESPSKILVSAERWENRGGSVYDGEEWGGWI